jgi:hypothetical protein
VDPGKAIGTMGRTLDDTTVKIFFILITINLISTSFCSAQGKGYIALSAGPGIPVGDFASKDPKNKNAGIANTGTFIDLSFACKLDENLGIAALVRGQANGTDTKVVSTSFSKQIPSGVKTTLKTGSWGLGGFMLGGYGSFPTTEKVSFEFRALLGYVYASSPYVIISFTGSGNSGWVKQESASSFALAYIVGAGFKFDAGKRICLFLNTDYFAAKPEFKSVKIYSNNGENDLTSFSQPYGAVSVGLGIGYRL